MPGGSLTEAVASGKGIGGAQRFPRMVGNHLESAKAEGSLTVTPTGGAGTESRLSDPVVESGIAIAQRIKATLGITYYHSQEFTSTEWFGTSMSAHRILGL